MGQLECDDSGNDQHDSEATPQAAGVAKQPQADQEGSCSANAGLHRIGGAECNFLLRQKQERTAERHCDERQHDPKDELPGLSRPFQPNRPADFRGRPAGRFRPTGGGRDRCRALEDRDGSAFCG